MRRIDLNRAAGEKYAPELRTHLDAEPDVLRRQLTIINWFFESYRSHLPINRILKYEDLVASGGISLFAAVGRSDAEPVDLASRNKSDLYAGVNVDRLLSTLVAAPGAWQHFYSIADCERLALEMGRAL